MMTFNISLISSTSYALDKKLIEEYKQIRSNLEKERFAQTENYYFLSGSVTIDDYDDDIEFIAEANAYENLEIFAFKKICWPAYMDTDTKVKIFYKYLENYPLFEKNKNITVLKKEKKRNNTINIIYIFDRQNNKIKFPTNDKLGLIDNC